jgi:hypothetical protein
VLLSLHVLEIGYNSNNNIFISSKRRAHLYNFTIILEQVKYSITMQIITEDIWLQYGNH